MNNQSVDIALLTAVVLSGSMLSFGMEPMVGRMVLPFYGGAVHVWVTCMMVFQGLLLLGYGYAHLIAPRIGRWHLMVLLVPLLQWPLGFASESAPDAPIGALVLALLVTISMPFAVLTTTSVVAQSWWARSHLKDAGEPFWLYAASNVGSLLALLAYPLVIEPMVGLAVQTWSWSVAYVAYVGLVALAYWRLQPERAHVPKLSISGSDPVFTWLMLAATPSALLLAITNHYANEVGSFPLIWVVPMALYLGSFVFAFKESTGWVVKVSRHWMALLALQIILLSALEAPDGWILLALALVPFTLLCVGSHRLLYELRPPVERLTTFYLWMAAGGFLGGTAVTLGAPTLLNGMYEPFLAVAALGVAMAIAAQKADVSWRPWGDDTAAAKRIGALSAFIVLIALMDASGMFHADVLARHRSFYGVYRIEAAAVGDNIAVRRLVHGSTVHGLEVEGGRAGAYYHPGSPLHDAVRARPEGPARVGVIGLGTGGMAYMVDVDDTLVYYEIHGEMEPLVREWFGFLDNAATPVRVVVGDARLKLVEESAEEPYDVLVIDAFSGDGIPIHLVTREAWEVYLSRLASDGLLAMHISNRFYDLRPVLTHLADDQGLHGVFLQTPYDRMMPGADFASQVVVLARNPARLQSLRDGGWSDLRVAGMEPGVVWTDDFAPALTALKF